MIQISSWLIVLSVICAVITMSFTSGNLQTSVDLVDPDVLAAIQAEDKAASKEQILQKLFSVLRVLQENEEAAGGSGGGGSSTRNMVSSDYDYGRLGLSKRQIRYHQCYFNPVSCFRRRK